MKKAGVKKSILNQSANEIKGMVGCKLPTNDGGWLKIMAFCDNYYMARFKGCTPFCCNENSLKARIKAYCL